MLSDHPLSVKTALESEEFQSLILPLINSLVSLMDGEESCLTVSISGDWGTGKTTVLRTLESFFRDYCRFPVLFFEAWRYKDDRNPLVSLVSELREFPPIQADEELSKEMDNVLRGLLLGVLTAGDFALKGISKLFLPFEIDLSKKAKDVLTLFDELKNKYPEEVLKAKSKYKENLNQLGKLIDKVRNLHIDGNKSLEEKWKELLKDYEEISSFHREENNRWFILIIDDLDRLFPKDAIKFIETLRFYFNIDRTLILMGINDRILNTYFMKATGFLEKKGISFRGENFFEKIFQWNYELSYEKLNDLHLRGLRKRGIKEEKIEEIKEILGNVVGSLSHRKWIKLINRIEKKLCLYRNSDNPPLKNLVILAIVKELFPGLELEMRRAPEVASDILQGNLLNLKQKFGTVLEEDTAYLREPLSTFEALNKNLKEEEL
jgi:hypothetical protein